MRVPLRQAREGALDPGADLGRASTEVATDMQAEATEAPCGLHAVLVGHVVSDENRATAPEGRGSHQDLHGACLGGPARADLEGHVGGQQDEVLPMAGQQRFEHGMRGFGALGCRAVMQGQAMWLALDDHAGPGGGFPLEPGRPAGRQQRDGLSAADPAGGVAQFRAMAEATGGQERREQVVHGGPRAAGHDGQGTIEALPKAREGIDETGRYADRIRRGRDVEKSAVEIEEERPSSLDLGNTGGSHTF